MIPASVNAIIAQRLIKRLCPHCKEKMSMKDIWANTLANIKHAINITNKQELQSRVWDKLKQPVFYKPVGCEHCDNSGYKWRVGLYEVLEITPGVKEMVLAGSSAYDINRQAIKDGMISLEQDGIMKALNWETSLEEVYRVAKSQKW